MANSDDDATSSIPSEMDVVDTFTQVILGTGSLSAHDTNILEALCKVDQNLASSSATSDADVQRVGTYLHSLGVREMIRLVAKVRDYYQAMCSPASAPLHSPEQTEALASQDQHVTR